jgi:peptidoglycan/LPS O-acetylase OafA/YrhL
MRPAPSGYRADIQALRAVAVLLVVVYHLWPSRLSGGFVGVDVFFVISGFLITGHLVKEIDKTGTISITSFWARRIRRLLPASFVVLLAALAATLLVLPRSVWNQTLVEVGASAVYAVNWVLAFNATDYLGAENAPSIVQHFWSLSVEEQFYILWPLLIIGALGLARLVLRSREMSAKFRRRLVVITLGVVVVVSFVVSILETARDQPFAYFATPTRAWEFGLGGLIAVMPGVASRIGTAPAAARVALSWLGLGAIVAAAVLFDGDTAFPGYLALLPVIGTVAVILAGPVRAPVSPMVVGGLRPVQVLGDLSYSIYLWHWPLIVLYPYVTDHRPGLAGGAAIVVLSVGLAWLTKRFIEDPVRGGTFWTAGRVRSYVFAAGGALTICAMVAVPLAVLATQRQAYLDRVDAALAGSEPCFGAAALAAGAECADPFTVPPGLDVAAAASNGGTITDENCFTKSTEGSVLKTCTFGSTDPDADGIALVGNSHARALASGLDEYATSMDWRFTTFMRQSCLGVVTDATAGDPNQDCLDWTEETISTIVADQSIDTVLFQSYAFATPLEFTEGDVARFETNVLATWGRLTDAGKSIAVVSDVPGTRPTDAPTCILDSGTTIDPCALPRNPTTTGNTLYALADKTPGIHTIDLDRYFCTGQTCHAVVGGVVVYFDSHHLTAAYARTLAPYFGAQLSEAVYPEN